MVRIAGGRATTSIHPRSRRTGPESKLMIGRSVERLPKARANHQVPASAVKSATSERPICPKRERRCVARAKPSATHRQPAGMSSPVGGVFSARIS